MALADLLEQRTEDWPYLKPQPGPGEVYACPECGTEAIFQCWHPETDAVRTVLMTKTEAWRLRNGGGRLKKARRIAWPCDSCGVETGLRAGALVGPGFCCDLCAPGPLHSRYTLGVREARRDRARHI